MSDNETMKTTKSKNKKPAVPLRKSSETSLRKRSGKVKPEGLSAGETRRMMRELQTLRTEFGKKTEELRNTRISLEEAEERARHFASFPQLNPNPVLELAASGAIVFINDATREILEDLGMDKDDASVFLPHDIDGILKGMEKKEKVSFCREVKIKDKVFGESVYIAPQFNVVRIYAFDITGLKRTEEALRKSNAFNQSIIDSSSDCIKLLDLEGRLQYMSPGGQHLMGVRDMGIYLNIPYEGFWKGTDHQAALEAIQKAKQGQSGSFQGYCPTVDGTPKWWDVAISPIFGTDGKPEHLLAVSRDITVRKQAEESLRNALGESEQRRSEIYALLRASRIVLERREIKDTAGGIFDLCKNLIGASAGYVALLSKDGAENEVLFSDSGGLPCNVGPSLPMPVRGLSEVAYRTGKTVFDNDFSNSEWVGFMPAGLVILKNVLFAPLIIQGKAVGILGLGNKAGGFTGDDADMASAFGELAAIALHKNRLMEALQKSRDELEIKVQERTAELLEKSRILESFFKHTQTCLVFLDRNFNFIRVNEAYAEVCSRDMSDFIGHNYFVDYPSDELKNKFQWVVDTKEPYSVFRRPFVFPDHPEWGVTYWDLAVAPVLDSKGEVDFLVFSLLDVTERKKAEDNIDRLNRLYSVLSKVNEAIVRIREPEKLCKEVCRIVVDEGSFKMAWIGLTDPVTRQVKPVVSYGDTGGYLNEIIIYAADVPEGKGPTGRAVFEDRYFICGDVEQDQIMRPWRDSALRHGFRSVAAFPLHVGACVIGAFTIYTGTPQFFSDEEISLLSSLVEDISFAIDVMDNERKRIEAEERLSLFNKLINQSSDFIFIVDSGQGSIIEVNDAACDTLGYRREEMLALKIVDISEEMVDYTVWRERVSEVVEKGQMLLEDRLRRKDGATFPAEVNVKYIAHEKKDYLVAIVRDITERKDIEDRINVTNAVLKLFVQKITRREYLDSVVEILSKWSRCAHVGIRRLDERGNIPYESFVGFSQEFIDSVSNLSAGNDQCACIRVLTGTPDPLDMSLMTSSGSLYSNNAGELLGGSSRFCGMCIRQGSKSLAIIPVRYHEKLIGVIHIADYKEGMLPLNRVEFIETLAPIIGEAIHSFNAEEDLRRSSEEMRKLTAHLQEVREAERTAISREIHDELGQIMTALKIDLSWIKNRYSDHILLEKTNAMMSLVDSTIQTIKRIITELRPNILDHLGLVPALEWQAEEFQRITGIPCDFICTCPEIVLEKNFSIHVFRVFQEILTNVARHSGATNVDVYLEKRDDYLILKVADNGKGIAGEKISNSPSFGIMGMRERAYSIGGDIKIVGTPQKGTSVTLAVPVQNNGAKR